MSVKSLTPLFWAPPRAAPHGPLMRALLKIRQTLEALMGAPLVVPNGYDSEEPMDEDRVSLEKILSDPTFWMFLNH
jgi:hypothetical protein